MAARFNLVLSDEMNRRVDDVATDPETKSSVIRKALAMYLTSVEALKERGLHVGLFDPATREIKSEIVGL